MSHEPRMATAGERSCLRELAKRQREYSQLPVMGERESLWYLHNDLKGELPMVHFETATCEDDLLPPLKCQSSAARRVELALLRNVLNHERIGDDRVVPSTFDVEWWTHMVLFDSPIGTTSATDAHGKALGYQFIHPITDLPRDLKTLKPTVRGVDREGTLQWKAFVEELLGDILPVRMTSSSLWALPAHDAVRFIGMEAMSLAMIDHPQDFHEFMRRAATDYVGHLRWLETEDLLLPNSGNNWVGGGTFGFTHDLPSAAAKSGAPLRSNDLWGAMNSQETASISPGMFGEFFYPHYEAVAENYGLLSYGCCEPVHAVWSQYLSKLPNLRKVSVSPWTDEAFMGEVLNGSRTIFHRKPSPLFIGTGGQFDEAGFRSHILHTILCAKGCRLEFSFRDVYSLGGNPEKPRMAVQIVRELLDEHWG